MTQSTTLPDSWHDLTDFNRGYAEELYGRYLEDPSQLDASTRQWFESHGAPPVDETSTDSTSASSHANLSPASAASSIPVPGITSAEMKKIKAAQQWVRNIRDYGHLIAAVNPIQVEAIHHVLLDQETYQLNNADLAAIPASFVWGDMDAAPEGVNNAAEVIAYLKQIYTGTLAFDFAHVIDGDERQWLQQMVEGPDTLLATVRTVKQKKDTLSRLIEVDEFEKFLHRTFVGQKRFSVEGVDMVVPLLDSLIETAARVGTTNIVMGMAHRGRLNVLAHVLGKPYADIFTEFHASPNKELVPSEGSMGINYGWTGDVKYHLGARRDIEDADVREMKLVLANNPSHLEFVDPVVEGYARALQEDRSRPGPAIQDRDSALAVLIHGDAAFSGEGVVAETLNMSRLPGYQTGGTIHIITNNQLGFTAEETEGRSTKYSSDLAKGFEIPVVHVNADDVEACLVAVQLAYTYRQRFHKDFLIDLVGYRRWGHNEMDDPMATQPLMYQLIATHPSVRELYEKQLLQEQVLSRDELARIVDNVRERLQGAYEVAKQRGSNIEESLLENRVLEADRTSVPMPDLSQMNEELLRRPPGFEIYPKLHRILERRRNVFAERGKVEWAHAEALALASIVADGTPIRMTGQDTQRGTFGQRHLVLHDVKTGERICTLQHLPSANASFDIYNSPLSEASVIGFEYGYSVLAPKALVIWEAQFGDFANAGQVLIDQFLSSGHAKWLQTSGLVLLLPHGYEGQGPEHSSARLERFLQLSAENNWRVVNPSTAAQYFHVLRLQVVQIGADARPLVVMTPKSLLRNARAASTIDELTEGRFNPILHVQRSEPQLVERLVLSSGKVSVDLDAMLEEQGYPSWLAVARVEQLYPFPEQAFRDIVSCYPNLREIVWFQEEPKNMGAWQYIQPYLASVVKKGELEICYLGRPKRSSPAEGLADVHQSTQKRLLEDAITYNCSHFGRVAEEGGMQDE